MADKGEKDQVERPQMGERELEKNNTIKKERIHLVSGTVCVGTRRAESYDSLGFSESA